MKKLATLGWREYIHLPDLEVWNIKAKVDSGARTSCLHAFSIEEYEKDNELWIRFGLHPNQNDTETELWRDAKVYDMRQVTDSGGHREKRYVIKTDFLLGDLQYPAEVTLTNRDSMKFRMLLGRTAMNERFVINPAESYLFGKRVKS